MLVMWLLMLLLNAIYPSDLSLRSLAPPCQSTEPVEQRGDAEPPADVLVVPFPGAEQDARRVAQAVRARFSVSVHVAAPLSAPVRACHAPGRARGEQMVNHLGRTYGYRPQRAVIGVTADALDSAQRPDVFAFRNNAAGLGVISASKLRRDTDDEELVRERLDKFATKYVLHLYFGVEQQSPSDMLPPLLMPLHSFEQLARADGDHCAYEQLVHPARRQLLRCGAPA